ncbi:hypothetical protein Pla123a_15910 [Posidoniimonas polymericola]|uniref:PEP-CTERM protein-sorting domain-containing protein n=1 Tax=Posidoniimonas polymericola TaxID=2528002 RepID=A0A5C5YS84_9BACT|nr:hypothetical protein [Posidoniimonas polymericola]TWT77795.1 hypothetical protein Pla123a_15910 [Posidoniimonas polymericola]
MKAVTSAALAAVFLLLADQTVRAQSATIDFESLPLGTTYGASSGDSPGDLAFTEDGVDVRLQNYSSGSFSSATVGGFMADKFSTTPMTISNINLDFEFGSLPFDVGLVTFEYADSGGTVNLGVNGTNLSLADMTDAPASIAGVAVSVTASPIFGGVFGEVTLTGQIDTVRLGGQEFGVDNLRAEVPEPLSATLALLGLIGVAAARRRF